MTNDQVYEYTMPKERISIQVLGSVVIVIILNILGFTRTDELGPDFPAWLSWALFGAFDLGSIFFGWWLYARRKPTTFRFAHDGLHVITKHDHCILWENMSTWMSVGDFERSKPFYGIQKLLKPAQDTNDSIVLLQRDSRDTDIEAKVVRTIPVEPQRFLEVTKALSRYLPRHGVTTQKSFPQIGKSTPKTKRVIKVFFYISIGILALAVIGIVLAFIESTQ